MSNDNKTRAQIFLENFSAVEPIEDSATEEAEDFSEEEVNLDFPLTVGSLIDNFFSVIIERINTLETELKELRQVIYGQTERPIDG